MRQWLPNWWLEKVNFTGFGKNSWKGVFRIMFQRLSEIHGYAAEMLAWIPWIMSEALSGTSAPAISLMEKQPAIVIGEEHYFQGFHWASCFATPIFSEDGSVQGVLDFSTLCKFGENLWIYFSYWENNLIMGNKSLNRVLHLKHLLCLIFINYRQW